MTTLLDGIAIKGLLERKGLSLREVGRRHSISVQVVSRALKRPSISGELAIVSELGIPAPVLWPDRYGPDGQRLVARGRWWERQPVEPNSKRLLKRRQREKRSALASLTTRPVGSAP